MDQSFFSRELLGLELTDWAKLIGLWLLFSAILLVVRKQLFTRFSRLAERTTNQIDDIVAGLLQKTRVFFILIVALYFSAEIWTEDVPAVGIILRLVFLGLLVQVGLWGMALIGVWAGWFVNRDKDADGVPDVANVTAVKALELVGRVLVWSIVVLMALDNFGLDVTALIAGLGIGGLAIGLALQNVLQDILAYVSIIVDKPFVYGDFMVVGEYSGTVEHIGIKSTRVRSLSGEQIVFGNADLLSSRVRNYKRMQERRALFSVGVTYDTPYEKLRVIPDRIRTIIEGRELTRFDRAHLRTFGDSAIVFEVVYFMLVPDYAAYMDAQQDINLGIRQLFEAEAIEFAFPTQTIHVESLPERAD
jgi:small-conductance mechanosensitive channel